MTRPWLGKRVTRINDRHPELRGASAQIRKSNQVKIGAAPGSFLEPARRSSRTRPPDVVVEGPWNNYPRGSWLARKDSNLRSPDPEDSGRLCRWSVRFERGADSDSCRAGNQVEHAGRSQVNVIRSSNTGIYGNAVDDGWERERFPLFPLLS